jgi:hydrogenase-4 component B
MIIAKLLPIIPVVLIGLLPVFVIKPLMSLTNSIFKANLILPENTFSVPMKFISYGAGSLIILIIIILAVRKILMSRRVTSAGTTWGCGYGAVDSKQQYTATSFVQEYAELTRPIIKTGHTKINYREDEIFPEKRDFHTHSDDFIRSKVINKPAYYIINIFRRAAVLQTGKLQHYILYVLLFLILIFFLTYLKLI